MFDSFGGWILKHELYAAGYNQITIGNFDPICSQPIPYPENPELELELH
jgi:hypothetical protein